METVSERPRRRRRIGARASAAVAAGLMLWSIVGAAGTSVGQEGGVAVEEPAGLSAYNTVADAAPVQAYLDHQTRLIPLGPAIAHSQSEVALPSTASSIAWLVDAGVANGLHGTSTGNRVPTEASAKQPGGEQEEEFRVAGGPIGHDSLMSVRAGRALARAEHNDTPTAYANAFFGNLAVLPAAGAVGDDPPGTFDPGARAPNQDAQGTDPQPLGQMAIVSVGSIASTARSVREDATVRSIAVAELKDINVGNRTSDNRCTNCMRIDWIRVEAYAQAKGTGGGAQAAYRVTGGRACRRAFDGPSGVEQDRCLPLNPRDPQGTRGLQSVDELEQLNAFFERPIWYTASGGAVDYAIGVRLHVGSPHCEPARAQRTPPDDACRNRASGTANGEVAKAVAEGIDVEIWTLTISQIATDAARRLAGTPAEEAIRSADQDDATPGVQLCPPGPACNATGPQSIPTDSITTARRVHLTLGVAKATAVARAGAGAVPIVTPDTGVAPVMPGVPPIGGVPTVDTPAPQGGNAPAAGPGGPYKIRIRWASMRVRPWPPGDMAKAIAVGGIVLGTLVLMRRRLGLG